jgi:serine protease inhibitor
MASVLRFEADQDRLHAAFSQLNEQIFDGEDHGYKIRAANRLWGQQGYQLRAEFLELLRTRYGADLEQLDFGGQPESASKKINRWVLGSIERELHSGLPCDLSPKLRLILGDARFCSWITGDELKDWKQRRIGNRKYSEWICGFVTRDIPRLLDHGGAEDVRFIFEFSP